MQTSHDDESKNLMFVPVHACHHVTSVHDTSYVLPHCSLSVFKRSFINWTLFTL